MPTVDIGEAVRALWSGRFMTREGWNGKGQYLGMQTPDDGSKNTLPYIWIMTADGQRVPWVCSQTDLLAVDWTEYHGTREE